MSLGNPCDGLTFLASHRLGNLNPVTGYLARGIIGALTNLGAPGALGSKPTGVVGIYLPQKTRALSLTAPGFLEDCGPPRVFSHFFGPHKGPQGWEPPGLWDLGWTQTLHGAFRDKHWRGLVHWGRTERRGNSNECSLSQRQKRWPFFAETLLGDDVERFHTNRDCC